MEVLYIVLIVVSSIIALGLLLCVATGLFTYIMIAKRDTSKNLPPMPIRELNNGENNKKSNSLYYKFVSWVFPQVMGKQYFEWHKTVKDNIPFWKIYSYEQINTSACDGIDLVGYYFKSRNASNRWVVFSHGYNSNSINDFSLIAKYYFDNNYNVLAITHRASGKSKGKYITFGVKESRDLAIWVDWIINKDENAKIILHGLSMGASTVLRYAGDNASKNVVGVISDSGFSDVFEIVKVQNKRFFKLPRLSLIFMDRFAKLISGISLKDANTLPFVKKIEMPILVIHGDDDRFVPPPMAKELFNNCNAKNKSLVYFKDAGHIMSVFTERDKYYNLIDEFIKSI